MHIVGIDISKDCVHVATIENRAGASPSEVSKFDQTPRGWRALLKSIPDPASAIVVFESTGIYGRQLSCALNGHVRMLCQVNPRTITRFGCSMLSIKSDTVDAAALATIGGFLARERMDLLERQQIDLRPARADLELLLMQYIRLGRHVRSEECAKETLAWHNSELVKEQQKSLDSELKRQRRRMTRLRKLIVQQAQRLDSRTYSLLVSIPGIGVLTASALVEAIGDIRRFETPEALKAYFGLHPTLNQSGQFQGRPRMARHGDALVRHLMWNCAKSAAKHNPPCAALFQRGIAKGKHPSRAWGAVASKLMTQVYGVLKSGVPFDPEWCASKKASPAPTN